MNFSKILKKQVLGQVIRKTPRFSKARKEVALCLLKTCSNAFVISILKRGSTSV